MPASSIGRRASWTLIDQAVVSACGFLTQVLLARGLPAADYGTYGLVLAALLLLQLFNATLIFYPMTVCLPGARPGERPGLLGATAVLTGGMTCLLTLACVLGLMLFGRADLCLVVAGFFAARQAHEASRRALFAEFRHRDALLGDAIAYLPPIAALVWLQAAGALSLASGFTVMAIAAALGAVANAARLTVAPVARGLLREVLGRYWRIGGLPSLGNSVLTSVPYTLVPWSLAFLAGPGAVAQLQAAMNLVNLANPLQIAVGNVVPQAAAHAAAQGGARAAWRAVRTYGLLAAPVMLAYALAIWAAPEFILGLLYGASSHYAGLGQEVRLLVLVAVIAMATEFLLSYLVGLTEMRRAMQVNAAGAATVAVCAFPLVATFGLVGGCIALLVMNLVRLGLAVATMRGLLAPRGRPQDRSAMLPQSDRLMRWRPGND